MVAANDRICPFTVHRFPPPTNGENSPLAEPHGLSTVTGLKRGRGAPAAPPAPSSEHEMRNLLTSDVVCCGGRAGDVLTIHGLPMLISGDSQNLPGGIGLPRAEFLLASAISASFPVTLERTAQSSETRVEHSRLWATIRLVENNEGSCVLILNLGVQFPGTRQPSPQCLVDRAQMEFLYTRALRNPSLLSSSTEEPAMKSCRSGGVPPRAQRRVSPHGPPCERMRHSGVTPTTDGPPLSR